MKTKIRLLLILYYSKKVYKYYVRANMFNELTNFKEDNADYIYSLGFMTIKQNKYLAKIRNLQDKLLKKRRSHLKKIYDLLIK